MKRAIISGATGLVGTSVATYLSSHEIDVLCLGRRELNQQEIRKHFGVDMKYISLPMKNISILDQCLDSIGWVPGDDCVFYNFAWSGRDALTDGDFSEQMENATYAANAVREAKKNGCVKYVNAGTIEETYVDQYVHNKINSYTSSQTNYALSKVAARDLCKIVAYLEKIDYVHTRLSVPLASDLSRGGYVATTLKKIAEGSDFEAPKNQQLFDIVLMDDVAKAYYHVGLKGNNKSDYFIGTSEPARLDQHFRRFEQLIRGNIGKDKLEAYDDSEKSIFDTHELNMDTGFVATKSLDDVAELLRKV